MKIEITNEEREELKSILELLKSYNLENIKLAKTLLKKYKKFTNTVFCFDFTYVNSSRKYIKREIKFPAKDPKNLIWLFDYNMIFGAMSDFDLGCLAAYITAVLEGNNSFYIG